MTRDEFIEQQTRAQDNLETIGPIRRSLTEAAGSMVRAAKNTAVAKQGVPASIKQRVASLENELSDLKSEIEALTEEYSALYYPQNLYKGANQRFASGTYDDESTHTELFDRIYVQLERMKHHFSDNIDQLYDLEDIKRDYYRRGQYDPTMDLDLWMDYFCYFDGNPPGMDEQIADFAKTASLAIEFYSDHAPGAFDSSIGCDANVQRIEAILKEVSTPAP